MKRVLITGANRGLGLEFARQYRAAGAEVIGTCRRADAANTLRETGAEIIALDVTDGAAVDRLAAMFADRRLDLVICNAGVAGARAHVAQPVTASDFDLVMRTNVFGPMRLIAAIASRMANPGAIAVISSRMGSIGGMGDGGYALYRASKAAVNAVTRAASLEFAADGLAVLALHPGWVKTDMGGADADIDVATSVSGMRRLIDQASARESGRFFDYTGTELSW